jgi:anti-sigma regulatory factor (Ser/Thr protein kinase)
MTAGDIDEHMSIIREHDIGNVLSKGGDFHVDEIRRYVESLLDGDIFGLEKNFPQSLIERRAVRSYVDAREACSSIAGYYDADDRVLLEIAIDELVSNAVFHGMLRMSGVSREQWQESYAIEGEQTVTISWAKDEEKIGVSVEDPMGNLKTRDVLRWLDHQIADTASEPDEEHGRGLILVRRLIDRFIVNIDVGKRTECIVIQYHDRSLVGNKKPLLIHEI